MLEYKHEKVGDHSIRFVESSPRVRNWFWFVVLIWISSVVFLDEFDKLFPISGTVQEQIETLVNRSKYALILQIAIYAVLSILVLILTLKVVRTRQWPPARMQVPFRMRVQEIHRPIIVWIVTTLILIILSINVGLSIYNWRLRNQFIEETARLVVPSTSNKAHNQ